MSWPQIRRGHLSLIPKVDLSHIKSLRLSKDWRPRIMFIKGELGRSQKQKVVFELKAEVRRADTAWFVSAVRNYKGELHNPQRDCKAGKSSLIIVLVAFFFYVIMETNCPVTTSVIQCRLVSGEKPNITAYTVLFFKSSLGEKYTTMFQFIKLEAGVRIESEELSSWYRAPPLNHQSLPFWFPSSGKLCVF